MIQYQILQTHITRTVQQIVRRITNKILVVKGLTVQTNLLFTCFVQISLNSRLKPKTDQPLLTLKKKKCNPLHPKIDQHLISSHIIIIPESLPKVKRIKEMITNYRISWLLNEFSLSAPWEMYREEYGDYGY